MKQTFFILFSIFVLVFFVEASKNKKIDFENNSRSNYKSSLNDVILSFSKGKKVSIEKLQNVIPISQNEFSIYYSFTFPKKGKLIHKSFYSMDSQIIETAKKNKGLFLKLYLQLSPFVDGEYAEGYYDDVESIIEKNKNVFCNIYTSLNSDSKIKLKEYKVRYCKQ